MKRTNRIFFRASAVLLLFAVLLSVSACTPAPEPVSSSDVAFHTDEVEFFSDLIIVFPPGTDVDRRSEIPESERVTLSYNQASEDRLRAWRENNGDEDGLWEYLFYVPTKNAYGPMRYCSSSGYYSWDGTVAIDGKSPLGTLKVSDCGLTFTPGKSADVCKAFTAPKSGRVTLETTVSRLKEYVPDTDTTPTGIAVWLNDLQIYPTDGTAYMVVTSVEPLSFSLETEICEGDHLYFRVNSVDGNVKDDTVNMENFITYTHNGKSPPDHTPTVNDSE